MRALITGGTKGIGRAVALRFAEDGGALLLNYLHDAEAASDAAAEVAQRGGTATCIKADAGRIDGALQVAERARQELGSLDALVHCAVAPVVGSALTIDPDELRRSVETNGLSLLWIVRACKDLLLPGASVVFVTSVGSQKAIPGYVAVGAAKALAESLVRYLAAELARSGVRVNGVCAGPVDTETLRTIFPKAARMLETSARQNPSGRAITPGDIAAVVALLVSRDARMIQGEIVRVDGGLALVS